MPVRGPVDVWGSWGGARLLDLLDWQPPSTEGMMEDSVEPYGVAWVGSVPVGKRQTGEVTASAFLADAGETPERLWPLTRGRQPTSAADTPFLLAWGVEGLDLTPLAQRRAWTVDAYSPIITPGVSRQGLTRANVTFRTTGEMVPRVVVAHGQPVSAAGSTETQPYTWPAIPTGPRTFTVLHDAPDNLPIDPRTFRWRSRATDGDPWEDLEDSIPFGVQGTVVAQQTVAEPAGGWPAQLAIAWEAVADDLAGHDVIVLL